MHRKAILPYLTFIACIYSEVLAANGDLGNTCMHLLIMYTLSFLAARVKAHR